MRKMLRLPALLLLLLLLAPAAEAQDEVKRLTIERAGCTGVSARGQGLAPSSQLFLLVRDMESGRSVSGAPVPVRTDGSGAFDRALSLDLRGIATVDVSVWTRQGETLTMTARDSRDLACGGTGARALPFTGVSHWLVLLAGILLGGGVALSWSFRYRPRHSRGS